MKETSTEGLCKDSTSDFTSQISGELRVRTPIRSGSFGEVYRCTVESSKGKTEAAVKVFKFDPRTDLERIRKGIHRELKVWLMLKHSTIVPLLGTAQVESSLPALVSGWMSSGTLYEYLGKKAKAVTPSARNELVKGIADGLHYLHTKKVIHGDLHPGNVLIDGHGNPRLTDFGLATVAGDPELQWTTATAECTFDFRWRAPEVIGIENKPERPTFKSDIYSFGSVMFFIISGEIPWKEKQLPQICVELSKKAIPARSKNICDNHWNLIKKCWSWNSGNRPRSAEVLKDVTSGGALVRKGTSDALQEYSSRTGNVISSEEREGNDPSSRGGITSLVQGSRGIPSPLESRIGHPKEEYRGCPRNVVLYGEYGMGKSSLINLITSRNVAETSSDTAACTTSHPPYDVMIQGQYFRLWDTAAGFNERSRGVVPATVIEKNWTAFLRRLDQEDGVHLIIYCVRGTREIRAPQTNYKTLSSVIGESNVPIVIVVTCVEDLRPVMAEWWKKNRDGLAEDGMNFSGYACVTTLRGGPVDSPDVRRCHAQSYEDTCRLILDHCSKTPHKTWGAGAKQTNFLQRLICGV